jgi:hypothetical protein
VDTYELQKSSMYSFAHPSAILYSAVSLVAQPLKNSGVPYCSATSDDILTISSDVYRHRAQSAVNLGFWFVAEQYGTPEFFRGCATNDTAEYNIAVSSLGGGLSPGCSTVWNSSEAVCEVRAHTPPPRNSKQCCIRATTLRLATTS